MKITFPIALTFLTKLPWPRPALAGPEDLARSMFWYPWVGALLGIVFFGAWMRFSSMLPAPAAAALLVCLTVLITGGLHLDGLADTIDGLGGGRSPEECLRIMKDSRVGTFGVLGLVLVLLLKYAFFLAAGERSLQGEFVVFPIASRWSMVLLAYLCPYARPEGGLGQAMTNVSRKVVVGASLTTLIMSVLLCGPKAMMLLAGAGVFVWLAAIYCRQTLGGVTGDVLGAANEIVEVLVLVAALLLS